MSILDKAATKWNIDRRHTKIPLLHKSSLTERKAHSGWLFVLPFVLGMILIYLPILLDSIWFSFSRVTTSSYMENGKEIFYKVVSHEGLTFYKTALNTTFLKTLLSGFQQLILDVPAILIFSLFIAVILNQKMIGRATFRAIFFIPVILSTGLMESINSSDILTSSLGVDDGTSSNAEILSLLDVEALFSNMKVGTELVEYVVDLVNRIYSIINYSGVQMLIFLAGLQSISPSIYEACQIEGATSWETFWKITFPMISPMILVNGIYTIIDSFTRSDNVVMSYINGVYNGGGDNAMVATAQSWIYFAMVLLVIAAFAGIASLFVFYQKRD
jgi:ABC-type sugar transport system permease subunit